MFCFFLSPQTSSLSGLIAHLPLSPSTTVPQQPRKWWSHTGRQTKTVPAERSGIYFNQFGCGQNGRCCIDFVFCTTSLEQTYHGHVKGSTKQNLTDGLLSEKRVERGNCSAVVQPAFAKWQSVIRLQQVGAVFKTMTQTVAETNGNAALRFAKLIKLTN